MSNNANKTTTNPIRTLLIANRGEIACRIIETAKKCGVRTVSVYSEADANALHVALADTAVCIGPAAASESYLNIDAILNAAKTSGADAVHPGYGFLSENPDLVDACNAHGIKFVGPGADAMRAMGLKDAAKVLMEKAGVPVVPGYHGDEQSAEFLAERAHDIGYPVLIKARAGGGGKGMRKVDSADTFVSSLESAQREAQSSFGDAAVLIEKYITHPRHIEVQIFADNHGNVVHLFERDCSLQRRHQKVIEEAPAPAMTEEVRTAMTEAAVQTARAINYVGAGTVEFIVDASGPLRSDGFWFMEMNTRLQVEHPVTEAVTGFDLVEWQLIVAAGGELPAIQSEIRLRGHAVEARLYAEDADAGFLPATGTLHRYSLANYGRVDSGAREGDAVQPFYDPMLAKLIAHADSREQAFAVLESMLQDSVVLGVTTNRAFLASLCANDDVLNGDVHTGLIENDLPIVQSNTQTNHPSEVLTANLALAAVARVAVAANRDSIQTSIFEHVGVWQMWGSPSLPVRLKSGEETVSLSVTRLTAINWRVSHGEQSVELTLSNPQELINGTDVIIQGRRSSAIAFRHGPATFTRIENIEARHDLPGLKQANQAGESASQLLAPMPGRIISVNCKAGDRVTGDEVLVIMEAMKMEHSLVAGGEVTVESVHAAEDEQIEQGGLLVTFASSG